MDGVVCSMRACDQEFWVENMIVAMDDVINRHRVHVVDMKLSMDLKTVNSQITAIVSDDYVRADLFPLS
jgi:hypothetical protein